MIRAFYSLTGVLGVGLFMLIGGEGRAGAEDLMAAILGIALLMVVHEGGHFFMARAFGMRVTKFSIGFGPTFFKILPEDGYFWFTLAGERIRLRLWKYHPDRHGPTVYQVAMIPFLAFVQIAGMNPFEEVDENDRGSYANASLIGRVLTIFAGPACNYLFASILFFTSLFFGGRIVHTTEVTVLEGRPAAAASIKNGDRIVEIAGIAVDEWSKMAMVISEHPGETIPVVVEREGQRLTLKVTPANDHGKGKIGVSISGAGYRASVGVTEAADRAIRMPPLVVQSVIVGLGDWVTGRSDGELSGPVGMVRETAKVAHEGWAELLGLLGNLSAYLGAFNLLPIPALDGARLIFLGYEATTRRRPNARIEAHIHAIGLVMMLGLLAWVTVNDIRRPERLPPPQPSTIPSAVPSAPGPTEGASPSSAIPSAIPNPTK